MKHLFVLLAFGIFSAQAHATLMVSPPSVSFIDVPMNGPGQMSTVYIENEGQQEVQLNFDNDCGSDFQITNFCELELMPNEECSIDINFTPTSTNLQECELWVTDTQADDQYIYLSGQGS